MTDLNKFSRRTNWVREAAPLARAEQERRAAGLPILDLTASNPTRCGLAYDSATLLQPLASAAALTYDPQPFGLAAAREAVCAYYARHDAAVLPGQVCLTVSTSEAYSFLFRLLCDPGDEVLIAAPSYPLFEYLAALDDVTLRPYGLLYDHGWHLDAHALREAITPRTRAVALVHPNNPTGHFTSDTERRELENICAERGLALLVDEVFLDYGWAGDGRTYAQGPHPALTFVLSGLSKIAGLPQMKASWLATFGPDTLQEEALARLEIIADTFLSVSSVTQHALPRWLAGADALQQAILDRVRGNLALLDTAVGGTRITRLQAEAGWYAVLRVPATGDAESLAVALLQETGVLLHPGAPFGFAAEGWLVVSLLPEPEVFRAALEAVVRFAG